MKKKNSKLVDFNKVTTSFLLLGLLVFYIACSAVPKNHSNKDEKIPQKTVYTQEAIVANAKKHSPDCRKIAGTLNGSG